MPEWLAPLYVAGVVVFIAAAVVAWAQDEDDLRWPGRLVFTSPLWPLVLVGLLVGLLVKLWREGEWGEWFRG